MEGTNNTPTFFIGTIPIDGDLILAPMDGYSDYPFRRLARSLGSALSMTEFVNAVDVAGKHIRLEHKFFFDPTERPVIFQILDNDPERILRAAQKLRTFNPDAIDINMGCPARSVSGRGAGAGLMLNAPKAAKIIHLLATNLDIPITAKIRIGWDTTPYPYIEFARLLEENGASMLSVHGRTRAQSYGGSANWDAIAEIKQSLRIPVIGNGDVKTTADIDRMKLYTNCDAIMIGRASIGNPWIFSRKDRCDVSPVQVHSGILEHLRLMIAFYGDRHGVIFFRKYLKQYLLPYKLSHETMDDLLTCPRLDVLLVLVEKVFDEVNK